MHINTVWSRVRSWCRNPDMRMGAGALAISSLLVLSGTAPLEGVVIKDLLSRKGASQSSVSSAPNQSLPARSMRRRAQLSPKPSRRPSSQPPATIRIGGTIGASLRAAGKSSSSPPALRQGPPQETPLSPVSAPAAVAVTAAPAAPAAGFPAFGRTVHPVAKVPDWGSMTSPAQWNRSYAEMGEGDFVPVPAYDLQKLTVPLQDLIKPRQNAEITRKLFYSTRYFGAYDIDKGEFTGMHAGVDLKLALGQPLLAVAGGRVQSISEDDGLGLHVVIEHRHPSDGTFYSVYGHMGSVAVTAGDAVSPGQVIGTVGMTGRTSGPHLHLQIDRDDGTSPHRVYVPSSMPSPADAAVRSVNPEIFIRRYAGGI